MKLTPGLAPAFGVAALIAFGQQASAFTLEYFGKVGSAAIPSGGMTADFKRGTKVVLSQPGTLEDLCAYLDGLGGVSGQQSLRFVLYRDANGVPGAKVTESGDIFIESGSAAVSYCSGTPSLPLTPGTYWIAIHSGSAGGVARYYYDASPANWYGNADNYADGPATLFGAGNTGGGSPALYGRVIVPADLAHAGRSSVAAVPSKGLTADYKRASAFTLTEPGRLERLSFYVDGKGGVTGNGGQEARMVLYRDSGGRPGAKVTEGPTFFVPVGSAGRWIQHFATPLVLAPGRYWVGLHSGNTWGVMRDFGDGPANFFANNDLFEDGAADPFGSGTAGTVTLSAFVSYIPGQFTTRSVGRTDVGVPSGGLTADMKRGSFFALPTSDAVVTELYAYLDGRGGAAGSQTARMVIYYADPQHRPSDILLESEAVTVLAGTAPGWVKFPVRPTRLEAAINGIFLVIHSGGTGGVIRNYGGGPTSNWFGGPDVFADGASQTFGPGNPGTGTVSTYARFTTREP